MSEEFKEDIGKEVKFFMKTGRKYTGIIKEVSKIGVIKLKDMFGKKVKLAEGDFSSCEINEEYKD